MKTYLDKVINLAKKTGDRVILVDSSNPRDIMVVMGLAEYEKLAIGHSEVRSLTEDQLLDRINRDIAIWKSENDFNMFSKNKEEICRQDFKEDLFDEDLYRGEEFDESDENDSDSAEEENMYYYNEPNYISPLSHESREESEEFDEKVNVRNLWKIPPEVKQAAEDITET
ncbi:MAG: hypothetical protein ABH830_05110 [Patescibacteria group bacterium]